MYTVDNTAWLIKVTGMYNKQHITAFYYTNNEVTSPTSTTGASMYP